MYTLIWRSFYPDLAFHANFCKTNNRSSNKRIQIYKWNFIVVIIRFQSTSMLLLYSFHCQKLRNEGYTHDEIKKSGGWSLLKQQHAINPNTVFKLHKNYDISWTGYKNYRQKEKIAELIKDQE